MKINDVVHKQDTRPLTEIMLGPIMVGKWLFDTGACLPNNLMEKRPIKLNLNQQESRGAFRTTLILNGV
jgi:hypothetical protein